MSKDKLSKEELIDEDFIEIDLSASAQDYLKGLLSKQEDDVLGIRIFINDYGTPKAETCIAYAREGYKKRIA